MRAGISIIRHCVVIVSALFVFLGIPVLLWMERSVLLHTQGTDAVSSASLELPAQPSGIFFVFLNTRLHPDTAEQWELFFSGGDAGVIMSDVSCLVMDIDSTGMKLAQRFQLRLPEHQMRISREEGLMLVSKAESKLFDTIIISKELADAFHMNTARIQDESGYIRHVLVRGE